MSSTPKRSHEEGSHSIPLKRPLEEASIFSSPGKLVQPAGNDFRIPFESGQDGRLAKVQRIEPRDVDKRLPLLHRMTSSPGNYLDHASTAENRSELRISKDAKDVRAETRETIRELYADTRIDRQVSKVENDVRLDLRGDEKELRSDRRPHGDFKGDLKFGKDSYTAGNSHLNWKETKEPHRGKRCFEPSTDGLDSWHVAQHGLQNTNEVAKNLSTAEERDSLEAHEAVGENKVDIKGEEKFREKDRKRKDEKQRDFGERDKERNDRRTNLQVVGAINEYKEPLREERETERWDRERSDPQKDKEHNGKEKDPIKSDSSNAKEPMAGSIRISDKEMTESQQQHIDDSWRAADRNIKDKGRVMDVDASDT